ncbi:MAG: NTP transferase domain-containing protein [Acidimicrobiia bacterium]|nr:NTP transferase domain-containing protein [Acidimicrobiia bacterium]
MRAPRLDAGFEETVVVQGAVDLAGVLPEGTTLIENHAWADGQATSLRVGVDHARRVGHDAVVVGLGDQPMVPAEAWRLVGAAEAPIAVASFGGRHRPPTRLAPETWDALPARGDEGARALMRLRPELVVAVPCPGEPADIDTVEDLRRWS